MLEGILSLSLAELIVLVLLAFLLLQPRDYVKISRWLGRMLNQMVRSDGWKAFQRVSQEMRTLPRNLMREAYMDTEELRNMDRELRRALDPRQRPPAEPPVPIRETPSQQANPPPAPPDVPTDAPNTDPK